MSLATTTLSGRAYQATLLKQQNLYIAWGSGDPDWDVLADGDLPSLVEATSLVAEMGRRVPAAVSYVLPDEDGATSIPVGMDGQGNVQYQRYTISETPTTYLYLRCDFDHADAASDTIREIALFGGTVVDPELPPGQRYFTPGQLVDPGSLIAMEIIRPRFDRSPSVRESYEFVLPL